MVSELGLKPAVLENSKSIALANPSYRDNEFIEVAHENEPDSR